MQEDYQNVVCQREHLNIMQVHEVGQLRPDSGFYFIDKKFCSFTLVHYLQRSAILKPIIGILSPIHPGRS